MKKMNIYEPAMCCPTGVCGVGVDPELLRISAVLTSLEKNVIEIKQYKIKNKNKEFMLNMELNKLIMDKGMDILPVTILDGKIVKTGGYPTNEEFIALLELSDDVL